MASVLDLISMMCVPCRKSLPLPCLMPYFSLVFARLNTTLQEDPLDGFWKVKDILGYMCLGGTLVKYVCI